MQWFIALLGLIGTLFISMYSVDYEHKKYGSHTSSAAAKAEAELEDRKKELAARERARAIDRQLELDRIERDNIEKEKQAKLEQARIERENLEQERAARIEEQQRKREDAKRRRELQAEADKRRRWEYVNNWRQANHGCDPPYKRFCTYVQGQSVGCSCQ